MQSEAELVLNLFLKFGIFEARCSYKIVLIKEKACRSCKEFCLSRYEILQDFPETNSRGGWNKNFSGGKNLKI